PPLAFGGETSRNQQRAGAKRPTFRRRISDWHDKHGCLAWQSPGAALGIGGIQSPYSATERLASPGKPGRPSGRNAQKVRRTRQLALASNRVGWRSGVVLTADLELASRRSLVGGSAPIEGPSSDPR